MEPIATLQRFQILAGELRTSKDKKQTEGQYIFRTNNPNYTTGLFDQHGITYEELTIGLFSVELSSCISGAVIFLTEENFRQRIDKIVDQSMHLEKHIGIIENENVPIFFDYQNSTTYIDGKETVNFLITNTIESLKVLTELKKEPFADYMNHQRNELVIHSATKGILKLPMPEYPVKLNPEINFKPECDLFIDKLSSRDFIIHFKNQLFNLSKEAIRSPLESIFLHLNQLIQAAENDYQLQLKNFSFEKFKTDLQKEKEKYFASLRELLNKILGQVVGVPVSIAASAYATYKVESSFVFILITIALGMYVGFAIYFQWLYWTDLKEIEVDFERDFKKIETNSGLPKADIEVEKNKVTRRIKNIKKTVKVYIFTVATLFIMFVIFILNQLMKPVLPEKMKVLFAQLFTN